MFILPSDEEFFLYQKIMDGKNFEELLSRAGKLIGFCSTSCDVETLSDRFLKYNGMGFCAVIRDPQYDYALRLYLTPGSYCLIQKNVGFFLENKDTVHARMTTESTGYRIEFQTAEVLSE